MTLPAGVSLIDGESRARNYPQTWKVPGHSERSGLRVGAIAKLGFEYRESRHPVEGERLWVIVTQVRELEFPCYVGTLDNVPAVLPMDYGDEVAFGPEHVLDIAPRPLHRHG